MVQIDKSKIEKQAREILEKFAKALKKVEKEHDIDVWVERNEYERTESSLSADNEASKFPTKVDNNIDNNFKTRMLNNAQNKDEDFIIAERGNWK